MPWARSLGWLLLGPRGQLTRRIVLWSVVAPVCWLVYTLIRGAVVDDRAGNAYYPYPFMNVQDHGYRVVLMNSAMVALLFLAIASGTLALDRRLPGVRKAPA